MKDYTSNPEEKNRFITHYDDLGEEILVHYADGVNRFFLKRDKEVIETMMKKQISDVIKNKRALYDETKYYTAATVGFAGISCMGLYNYINEIKEAGAIILRSNTLLVSSLSIIATLATATALKNHKELLLDLKKHILFIKNSKKINRYVYDPRLYSRTDIECTSDDFCINDVHFMDLRTIETLVRNAELIHESEGYSLKRKH